MSSNNLYIGIGTQSDRIKDQIIFVARKTASALPNPTRQTNLFLMSSLQPEIERRGAEIFDLVDRHPDSVLSKAGFYQRMMEFSMRDEHFKVQMFRFVDVLASLHHGTEIVRHLDEYFADLRNGFAPLVRTGVRAAKILPWFSGQLLRWNVSGMARQFIAGKNPRDVMKTLRKRRAQGIGFVEREAGI